MKKKLTLSQLGMLAFVLCLCLGLVTACGGASTGSSLSGSQVSEAEGETGSSEDISGAEYGSEPSTPIEPSTPSEPSTPIEPVEPSNPSASGEIAFPSNSGELQVIGSKLCDSKGNPVILRGLSTHGIAWFPDYINEAAFKSFREDWKCNVMRLAMYTHEYNGYCSGGDKNWLKGLIRKGVECATKNDMYVIVDWHVLNDNNPQRYKNEAIAFFREMSAEFANHNNVIYEICNEPCNGTSWQDIKSYAEEVIPVIRANVPNALIIVGTPNWSQNVGEAVANPISEYDNIMYALHFYAATHTDWLRNNMVSAIEAGLPIFVTEYGICDASGSGNIDSDQAEKWIKLMNNRGVSHCAWNISNKNETSAIFKSSCNKIGGWSENDLSDSGKWLYKMLRKWQV